MYRISTHGRYALRMMADIAEQTSNHPHAAGQTIIAEQEGKIPFLSSISERQEMAGDSPPIWLFSPVLLTHRE